MNRPPSILVDTGFEVDQNGGLTEIYLPKVVTTLNAPNKVTFSGTTLNYIPSTATALQELECTNAELSIGMQFDNTYTALETVKMNNLLQLNQSTGGVQSKGYFYGCRALKYLQCNKLQSITFAGYSTDGIFRSCAGLTSLSFPELTLISESASRGDNSYSLGTFWGCTGITSIYAPKLQQIICSRSEVSANICGTFRGCTGLTTLNLPSLQSITSLGNGGAFAYCTGLTDVTFGSDGHPVTSLAPYTFYECTQSGLTITIYTADGAALSGSPWGATNATIVYEEA